VQKSIANGIDIIRIFDALNDPRNLETAIRATIKEGGHVQAAISYTTSPFHSNERFAQYAKQLEEMGAHSICIKDMAGLLKPYDAYDLVTALKQTVHIPIELHTHYTSGLASMTVLKAVEAGCDIIDTAISPLAMGTSQPPTESIVATLAGTEYDTGLDLKQLDKVCTYFNSIRERYLASGLIDPKVLSVNVNALMYQVPGGMLSNLISQLKLAGKLDQLQAVLEEVPRVRADAGYPPLVTPSSQIVGTQAVNNVLFGENGRYSRVTKEFRGLIRGEYGTPTAPIDPAFRKMILGDIPAIDHRPADDIPPELESLRAKVAPYATQDEDVLSLALFEQVAIKFFEERKREQYGIDACSNPDLGIHTV
jgi:oxaloacetate decarboxylase alpha subunit